MLGDQSSRFRYVYPTVEGYSGDGTDRWTGNFRVFPEVNGDTREIYTSAIVIPRV